MNQVECFYFSPPDLAYHVCAFPSVCHHKALCEEGGEKKTLSTITTAISTSLLSFILFYINSALLYQEPFHVNTASCSCCWRLEHCAAAASSPTLLPQCLQCNTANWAANDVPASTLNSFFSLWGIQEKGYFGRLYCLLIVQPVVLGAASRRGWKAEKSALNVMESCGELLRWRNN